jgi:hypothetical protein
MSDLTFDKMLEAMRQFSPPPPDPFSLNFLRPSFAGLDVLVEPEVPKIALSKEVAELVGPVFAASVNAWLAERFGYREPVAKTPYILFGTKLLINQHDWSKLQVYA